jgi:hypothetical protein
VRVRRVALHGAGCAREADVKDAAHRALQDLIAPQLRGEHLLASVLVLWKQRRLRLDLVKPAHDRARADEPAAVEAHARHGDASVENRAGSDLSERQHVDALVGDALDLHRGLNGGTGM